MEDRIQIRNVEVLSNDWSTLKKTTFDYRLKDGRWIKKSRETYDRGNGAAILLYNTTHKTVILTSLFRFPVHVSGHAGMLFPFSYALPLSVPGNGE